MDCGWDLFQTLAQGETFDMKAFIRKHTPRAVWTRLSKAKYSVVDSIDYALGRRAEMLPPRSLRLFNAGDGDYGAIGEEFVGYFRQFCDLQRDHHVLDVGCGVGRMAIPLTKYLSPQGGYEGIDVGSEGIKWCSNHITPRFQNFRFQWADIFSEGYNRRGAVHASDYRFPFEDNSFEFAFLTSVFTHMLPDDVKNYLAELGRVLKPGGKCLITWLTLNAESERLIQEGRSALKVVHPLGICRIMNPQVPEDAVAYPEQSILDLYRQAGFRIELPIRYGSWCGRDAFLSFQDIYVARKLEG